MVSGSCKAQRQRLRAKTGCLTCKARRKKCDEKYPACSRCISSERLCQWPTVEDLTDRRWSSHRKGLREPASASPPSSPGTLSKKSRQSYEDAVTTVVTWSSSRKITPSPFFPVDMSANFVSNARLLSESTASQRILRRDLESVISRHFAEKYYNLIILPSCNPDFYYGWMNEIQELVVQHRSLQYSVLACAASHLHFVDTSSQMQELALTYYSQAIRGLSEMLASASQIEDHNGILMSVILLYLHGCTGRSTYSDIPRHVNAAIRILRLRLLERSRPLSIDPRRPFDRLAVESVLYQIFLVTTGSWSDPTEVDNYHFDAEFWLQAEHLLGRSTLFPGRPISFNSPVLGIPLPLYRLVLSIQHLFRHPLRRDPETLAQIRSELAGFEAAVLCDQDLDSTCVAGTDHPDQGAGCDRDIVCGRGNSGYNHALYKDSAYLYILISSILIEQLYEPMKEDDDGEVEGDGHDNDDDDDDDNDYETDTDTQTKVKMENDADMDEDGFPSSLRYLEPPQPVPPDTWQMRRACQILRNHRDEPEWAKSFIGAWPVYTLGFFVACPEDVDLVRQDLGRRWDLVKFSLITRYEKELENIWATRGIGLGTRG